MRARDYRRRAQDIRAFLDSYSEFISCVERVPDGYSERWVVRSEARSRVDVIASRVAVTAGAAAGAFKDAGLGLDYQPPGTMQTTSVNPALVWSTLLDAYPIVTPDVMLIVGQQAFGRLSSLADAAQERERGLAGFLARFIRFPSSVREAAGLAPRTVGGGLVSSLIAILQGLLVAGLGGAIAFQVAKYFGWLP